MEYDLGVKMSKKKLEFTKKLYGDLYFRFAIEQVKLPSGFIKFHKDNFCKIFSYNENDFRGKRLLDTGCGTGKHAIVLALMGAEVLAMDLSDKNIERAEKIKKYYKLDNIEFRMHNFMKPLPDVGQFDLISAHNWIMHAENPTYILKQFVGTLKIGGRLYLSVYHGNTFRFYTAFIARKVLRQEHYSAMQNLVRYHFPRGFKEFNDPDRFFLENIFDDFFSSYVHTTNFDIILNDCEALGLKPVSEIPDLQIQERDNFDLMLGVEKYKDIENLSELNLLFNKPLDEFDTDVPIIKESSELAQKVINHINSQNDIYQACSFCLGLYRLRASINKEKDIQKRYETLIFYLNSCLDNSLKNISYYFDVGTLYNTD